MTPASMLRVLDGLTSDRLLSASQRQLMDGNCLGPGLLPDLHQRNVHDAPPAAPNQE